MQSPGSSQVLVDVQRSCKDCAASQNTQRAKVQSKARVPAGHTECELLLCIHTLGSRTPQNTRGQRRPHDIHTTRAPTWSPTQAASALLPFLQQQLLRCYVQAASITHFRHQEQVQTVVQVGLQQPLRTRLPFKMASAAPRIRSY